MAMLRIFFTHLKPFSLSKNTKDYSIKSDKCKGDKNPERPKIHSQKATKGSAARTNGPVLRYAFLLGA